MSPKHAVLFVCMGNICRSPSAEGVFRAQVARTYLAKHLDIDSAGTHNYHPGDAPDPRSQKAARARGYDLSPLRARVVTTQDFDRFDYILAMDEQNLAQLKQRCPPHANAKILLFTEFSKLYFRQAVPDPYYGGTAGFETVLDMLEETSEHFIAHLTQTQSR